MHRKVYKIYPINDSFDITLNILFEFVKSEYEIKKLTLSKSKISADSVQVGQPPYEPFHKPKCIYVTLNFLSEKSWTNYGGHEYCELILKDKSKISIRWDIRTNVKEFEDFNIKLIRKLKLDKLNLIYKENKKQNGNNSN